MKKIILITVLARLTMFSFAQEEHRFMVGLKLWAVASDYADDTIMVGPMFSMDLNNDFWISAMGTFGKFDYGWAENYERDAEFVLGKSFQWVDVGVGFKYFSASGEVTEYWGTEKFEGEGYGPMIYVGFGQPFGELPLGWYGGVSLVPFTGGDLDDAEHFNVEAGMYAAWKRWNVTLGYRSRFSDDTYHGIAASLAVAF